MIYTLTLNPAIDRELRVPEFAFDTVLRASAQRVDFGGKGFNVSRMIAALGGESVALGLVGGLAGRMMREGLARLGLATDFVEIDGETRTNVSVVDGTRHLKVNEAGPEVSPAHLAALLDKVRALARAGDWWVLSGSLPPGVPETVYADVIRVVQGAGARAVLDASGAALRRGCEAGPWLAKPNAAEVRELTGLPVGTPQEVLAAARAVQRLGVTHVLVSLGAEGALLASGARAWLARPPRIEERNPIGAGDSMVAGVVLGLASALPVWEALRGGVASGAATASLDGTEVGSAELVRALAQRVEVSEQRVA